jgi:hypothetical protein
MPRPRKSSGKSHKGSVNPTDALIVASHHSAARGDVLLVREDLQRKMPSWQLVQSPPKNFTRMIHWVSEETDASASLGISGSFTEVTLAFALSNLPGANAIASLFDQFCIYAAHVRVSPEFSATGTVTANPGGTGQIITALDYDSTQTLGSWAAYQRMGTADEAELVIGKSYERYVKPVCSLVTGASNNTSNTGVAMARQWCNTSFPSIPHFGVRVAAQGNTTGTGLALKQQVTVIVGLRNNF